MLGTEFDVELDSVRVHRGVVQIRAKSGEVVAERLSAGESWTQTPPADAEPAGDELGDGEIEILDDDALEPASMWLKRASKQIRSQRFARARRSIRRALDAEPTRREQAEGKMLLADLALVSGNVALAISRYRRVASNYRRYSQGEAALFAAARLEAKRGRSEASRDLLLRYQNRYPKGRFAKEVSRKLQALGSPP